MSFLTTILLDCAWLSRLCWPAVLFERHNWPTLWPFCFVTICPFQLWCPQIMYSHHQPSWCVLSPRGPVCGAWPSGSLWWTCRVAAFRVYEAARRAGRGAFVCGGFVLLLNHGGPRRHLMVDWTQKQSASSCEEAAKVSAFLFSLFPPFPPLSCLLPPSKMWRRHELLN